MPTRKELIASGVEITPLTREEILMSGGELTPLNVKEKVLSGIVGGGGGEPGYQMANTDNKATAVDVSAGNAIQQTVYVPNNMDKIPGLKSVSDVKAIYIEDVSAAGLVYGFAKNAVSKYGEDSSGNIALSINFYAYNPTGSTITKSKLYKAYVVYEAT